MPSFGDDLKAEREGRARTIEEMALATGIRVDYLEALESGAFQRLPGKGFGKLYIRAYARVLGFDPRLLIERFDREHPGAGGAAGAAETFEASEVAEASEIGPAGPAPDAAPDIAPLPPAPGAAGPAWLGRPRL
ncbi:MAG TPA: helix-turn-helix domain-containing protein, partial [Candidatus Polarisedimenticolia bacterium]|nr:helix-turn-helix domain-containing protein [Candidatus Polarisedimenticolia bacterium]